MTKSLSGIVLLLATICWASIAVRAQQPSPKIGDAAPGLNLNKILHATGNLENDLEGLKGNVVVLEFWATWCSPCIPALKHFNALSEKFKGKPVRFIAVTDDDELKIAQFVKAQPIRTWIGLDKNRVTFDAYKAVGLPHTVVIDRSGRVAAITKPENVTEIVINDMLADRPISLPVKESVAADLEWDKNSAPDGIEPLTQVIIKPSNATTGGFQNPPGRFTADGAPLLALVIAAYQTSFYRVVNNLPESSKTYKVSINVPPTREETLYPLFQQALLTTFGITARREIRQTDVFVLTVPRDKVSKLIPSQSPKELYSMMRGQIRSNKLQIKTLAEQLESSQSPCY